MKLSAVVVIAALTLAGAVAAEAQPDTRSGPIYGYQPQEGPSGIRGPIVRSNPNQKQIAAGLKVAVPQMRLACSADRQSLCADETTTASADRCVAYHRLKVSAPCKHALINLELARRGAL